MRRDSNDAIDRRRFLQWAVLGSAALLTNAACDEDRSPAPSSESEAESAPDRAEVESSRAALGSSRDRAEMAGALVHAFDYLDLDSSGVDRYCLDYVRHRGTADLDGREFYSLFLLSSDFFRAGSDEGRKVHYVAFYDPYVTGCPNPFARLDPA